ncbi:MULTISPECIES: hypothetical protein [unclassified Serratia (in: enterobacteria)]|uniref:hypothetical protein n=1 Tax=unclassified Serratia (in: enterobacteria) TaxID=2647522 RepID=UPI003B436C23
MKSANAAERLRQQAIEMRLVADEVDKSLADKADMKKTLQPCLLAFLQAKHKTTQATDELIDARAAEEKASSELIAVLKSLLP